MFCPPLRWKFSGTPCGPKNSRQFFFLTRQKEPKKKSQWIIRMVVPLGKKAGPRKHFPQRIPKLYTSELSYCICDNYVTVAVNNTEL